MDETYIKVHGDWMYLYRAVDSAGNTLEFMLSPVRDARAAECFLCKLISAEHTVEPRVINVDGNAAYPPRLLSCKLTKRGQLAVSYARLNI